MTVKIENGVPRIKPGEIVEYYRDKMADDDFLPRARAKNRAIHERATAAARAWDQGLVELVQRRNEDGSRSYLAIGRKVIVKRAAGELLTVERGTV